MLHKAKCPLNNYWFQGENDTTHLVTCSHRLLSSYQISGFRNLGCHGATIWRAYSYIFVAKMVVG